MESPLRKQVKSILKDHRKRMIWLRAVSALAIVVVFVTTYMLILPAVTMENKAQCGITEHTHDASCYTSVYEPGDRKLTCTLEGLNLHKHTGSCYNSEGRLICGYADYVVHKHNADCYDANGSLVCDLGEHTLHVHTDSCYKTTTELVCGKEEQAGHTHTEACYTQSRGALICANEEHMHGTECFSEDGTLICEKQEHTHDDSCYEVNRELTCTIPEIEGHTHTDACYQTKTELVCTEPTELHAHTDICYTDGVLSCSKTEVSEHVHGESCFTTEQVLVTKLICDRVEHAHTDECYAASSETLTDEEIAATQISNAKSAGDFEDESSADETTKPKEGSSSNEAISIGESSSEDESSTEEASEAKSTEELSEESSIEEETSTEELSTVEAEDELTEEALTEEASSEEESAEEASTEELSEEESSEEESTEAESTEEESSEEESESNDGIMLADESSVGLDMGEYIGSIVFQKKNGVIWENSTEFTTADQVRAILNFEGIPTTDIKKNSNTIYIDLPEYIDCSRFTGTYPTYDGSTQSGSYTYEKNADGSYRIKLVLLDDYINRAGDNIGGNLQFNFVWTGDAVDESGKKTVEIGNWSGEVTVTEDKSNDENNSNANYSVEKEAGSLYYSEDGKTAYIDYTVTLTVKKDMTAPVSMKDVLTGEGFDYDSEIKVTGGDVKVNFDSNSASADGTASTQIQLWPNSGSTVSAGTYTITYRVKSESDVSDPATKLPDKVNNKIRVPADDDNGANDETYTNTKTGTINKQGQLVSGSDATYIDYTVYLNAGDIVKNLTTPASFSDVLPDNLELVGDVTVKQYDVTGKEISSTAATADGQNISYTTPTGQYYYVITYRTKLKESENIPIGGITVENKGKSTGGVNGESSSKVTIPNHVLEKEFVNQQLGKDDSGKWIDTIKWSSTVAVEGSLEGYVYKDWADLKYNETEGAFSPLSMSEAQRSAIVVKDSSGNVLTGGYTIEPSDHTDNGVANGLFKITFTSAVNGPVTIEYETSADMSKFAEGSYLTFTNWGQLSKDGNIDKDSAQTGTIRYEHDSKNVIHKYGEAYVTNSSGSIKLEPGQTTIPWTIQVNEGRNLTGKLTVTDTIASGMTLVEDSVSVVITGMDASGVTWSYDKETGKLIVDIPDGSYYNASANQNITISYRTQLPDSFFEGANTSVTFSNTASIEYNGNTSDSTFDQTVTRQVVDKTGSYDKSTKILTYNVIVNPDASTLNGGNTLTVTDALDASTLSSYIKLHSLRLFTALKTTGSDGKVSVEPGKLVQELTPAESGSEQFTYVWDDSSRQFTTYLPDSTAYVIVAKYYVDADVSEKVQMKNSVKIEGNDSWKKDDNSASVDQTTSGDTHTEVNKLTVVKHDTAQYSTFLSGAVFSLESYSDNAWKVFNNATTGKDGTCVFEGVDYSTLYRLVETAAPDGYIIDETPAYFIIVKESNEAIAKDNLPDSIEGDSFYSKDAVRVYTVKDDVKTSTSETKYYANIEIDRYNEMDKEKVEPGQLRVTKSWKDSSGNVITDETKLGKMPEIRATLVKHAPEIVKITFAGNSNSIRFTKIVPKGSTVISTWASQGSWVASVDGAVNIDTSNNMTRFENITQDVTVTNSAMYIVENGFGASLSVDSSNASTGKVNTIIGTVTLNAANDWTYLWTDLERGDGISYTLTENTVNGYNVSYMINGSELTAGTSFSLGENGDKVVITNTEVPQYELPETGGSGTFCYTLSGLLFIVVALLLMYIQKARKGGARLR